MALSLEEGADTRRSPKKGGRPAQAGDDAPRDRERDGDGSRWLTERDDQGHCRQEAGPTSQSPNVTEPRDDPETRCDGQEAGNQDERSNEEQPDDERRRDQDDGRQPQPKTSHGDHVGAPILTCY